MYAFKIKRERRRGGGTGRKAAGGRGARLKRDTTDKPEAGEEPFENKQSASRSRSLCVYGILIIPRPGPPWSRPARPRHSELPSLCAPAFLFSFLGYWAPPTRLACNDDQQISNVSSIFQLYQCVQFDFHSANGVKITCNFKRYSTKQKN